MNRQALAHADMPAAQLTPTQGSCCLGATSAFSLLLTSSQTCSTNLPPTRVILHNASTNAQLSIVMALSLTHLASTNFDSSKTSERDFTDFTAPRRHIRVSVMAQSRLLSLTHGSCFRASACTLPPLARKWIWERVTSRW
jgi:hypothetical protein